MQPPGSPPESLCDDSESRTTETTPTTTMGSPSAYDPMDDIFGSDAGSPVETHHLDARHLQAQHNTVGYREGITAGKAQIIQVSFDDGFELGAHIGAKIGPILGILEAISTALIERGPRDEFMRVSGLWVQAVEELSPAAVFAPAYWSGKAAWTYPVAPTREDGKITHGDIAAQHPLVIKWDPIARAEAAKWNIDLTLPILENVSMSESTTEQGDATVSHASDKPDNSSRAPLEW